MYVNFMQGSSLWEVATICEDTTSKLNLYSQKKIC